MSLVLSLSSEEEAQFEAWAAEQGEEVQRDARVVLSAMGEQSPGKALASHFFKAVTLTQPVLTESATEEFGIGQYLLMLLKAMTALYHDRGGQSATLAELSRSTPLEDAVTLYDLGVVSVQLAARIAHMSVTGFLFTVTNRRRIDLIRKRIREGLTSAEEAELHQLQEEVRQHVDARLPLPALAATGQEREAHPPQTD